MADHINPPFNADETSMRYLRELASLNYRFIKLLSCCPTTTGHPVLPDTLRLSLSSLPEESHRRLSSCPYSLFDLNFADSRTWTEILSAPPNMQSEAPHAAHQFTLAALIFTQHVAHSSADLGALLLGLTHPVAAMLRKTSVGQLMDRIDGVAVMLRMRLINDPNFWPDLVNYVRDGTPQQYLAAQTSALQLMAAHGVG